MSRPLVDLLSYVRPTFFVPAVAMSVYGGSLAPTADIDPGAGVLHACLVGLTLFVAHLWDGYVDGHRRGEETPRLGVAGFRRAISLGSVGVVGLAGVLGWLAGPIVALSAVVLLALALFHEPYLDRNPVTVTVDYPVGIGVALLGGYAIQTREVALPILGVAAALSCSSPESRSGSTVSTPDSTDRSGSERSRSHTGPAAPPELLRPSSSLPRSRRPRSWGLSRSARVRSCGGGPDRLSPRDRDTPSGACAVRVQIGLTYVFAALVFGSVCDGCAGLGAVGGLFDGRFGAGGSFVVGSP